MPTGEQFPPFEKHPTAGERVILDIEQFMRPYPGEISYDWEKEGRHGTPKRHLVHTVEESNALLREIFPNWPDQRGMRPPPVDPRDWLRQHRERDHVHETERIDLDAHAGGT